jgi:hypothetical protein
LVVNELRRRILGVLAAVSLAVAGCGSDSNNEVNPAPSSSASATMTATEPSFAGNPCASNPEQCSNQEVTVTNCDGSSGGPKAFNATTPKVIQIGTVTGALVGRKANAAQCLRTFWALFEPAPGVSSGDFKVTTQVGDVIADQASEPGNDKADAWTEGLYAPEGTKVIFCLVVGSQQECLETPSV